MWLKDLITVIIKSKMLWCITSYNKLFFLNYGEISIFRNVSEILLDYLTQQHIDSIIQAYHDFITVKVICKCLTRGFRKQLDWKWSSEINRHPEFFNRQTNKFSK